MEISQLKHQVDVACRHLLSEQNRDPYTLTYGCFDRRYWGWKLIDYPEATFQRNVYPLAWLLEHPEYRPAGSIETLKQAVMAGLTFAMQIQHSDGSFDQAFPHEHSFGATAFLLSPLLQAYKVIQKNSSSAFQASFENCLLRATRFLCNYDETHGYIANHLAGAVFSLMMSAEFFQEPHYEQRATDLLERVLRSQSPEGWFIEYEGADPGYQTLCLYYLANIYTLRPTEALRLALEKALTFLAWFVHPDGTFGGEYGSRRTAIFYPGGLALLSREFPLAQSIIRFMLRSMTHGHTITLQDVDMGNLAPLLTNYIAVLETELPDQEQPSPFLPCEKEEVCQDFTEAGLYIRGTRRYYAIIGASNGGVLKVFDRQKKSVIWNDGGYVGQTRRGDFITTQITDPNCVCRATPDEIMVDASFHLMLRSTPTPLQFVLLRILNLTIMRSVSLGNWVKNILVNLLISGKRTVPFRLTRVIRFEDEHLVIEDVVRCERALDLRWLEFGRPFVAIHMASARYFEGFESMTQEAHRIDVETLNRTREIKDQVSI